jgi:transketolase
VNPHLVAISGDVKNSTFSEVFQDAYPDHFYQGYIAEQNLVSAGVGLAARGKVPFLDTFACFLARAYDQVRMAAISRSNINLCGSHCGISIGEDGPSQMALEDIAIFRAVHSSAVFYPSDAVSAERLWRRWRGGPESITCVRHDQKCRYCKARMRDFRYPDLKC